jgi:putative hydrolase of the HAD superfamily
MIRYARYRHISFDLWLTLIKSDPRFKQGRNELLKQHFGIRLDDTVIAECVRKYDILFNTINEKTGRNIDSDEMWWMILHDLGVDLQQTSSSAIAGFETKAEKLFFQYPPVLIDEKTADVLSMLRRHDITLSTLSNTAFIRGRLLRKLLQELNIADHFHFQVYSDEVGYSKPHPGIFHSLYQEAGNIRPVAMDEIVHIGDNPVADVKGANDFGITGILFSYQTNKLSDCFS